MSDKPPALLVYVPALNRDLLTDAQRERLERSCRLLLPEPVFDLTEAHAARAARDAEILVTGWGCPRLDAAALEGMPALRAAFHAAGTVKNHVTPAVFERGIRITSAAEANAIPVAEYALAVILLAGKRVFRMQRRYRESRTFRMWSQEFPGAANLGKVIGIVGASRIGRRVIAALQAFDFDVLVADPHLDDDSAAALGAERCTLDDLLRRADVVSLHAPSLPETRHMIDAAALASMRDGAVLVNTARGALVDHEALTEELLSGRLDAVLDTTEPEVLPADSPLYDLDNVFLTPHIAGSLGVETQRMMDLALDELERHLAGAPLLHEVLPADWDRIA